MYFIALYEGIPQLFVAATSVGFLLDQFFFFLRNKGPT